MWVRRWLRIVTECSVGEAPGAPRPFFAQQFEVMSAIEQAGGQSNSRRFGGLSAYRFGRVSAFEISVPRTGQAEDGPITSHRSAFAGSAVESVSHNEQLIGHRNPAMAEQSVGDADGAIVVAARHGFAPR